MLSSFIHKCLTETLQGLRDGLTLFSGPSTAAVIFTLPGEDNLFIYDPDMLLRDHETIIKNYYFDEKGRILFQRYGGTSTCYSNIEEAPEFKIDGLISYGGCSATVPYQMWFTQHHPDLSSTGPTERWLEHTVLRFSHDIANDAELYTGISGSFLREYSTYAIYDHVIKESSNVQGAQFNLDLYPILETILAISKTREEGAWPEGELTFLSPEVIDNIHYLARFLPDERPQLTNTKHVRKLLQTVESNDHKLISDGSSIIGISTNNLPGFYLTADFRGRFGFLRLANETICSFSDGRYRSSSLKAKLFEVEEALLDHQLPPQTRDSLFNIISKLVHNGQSMRHGCTFVLDLNRSPTKISGQLLQDPLDLRNPDLLELACALSKVDGALHIHLDEHLHGFACLLDGHAIDGEDRARGARYNSALRFTSETPNTIVIVVSSDRPVSVIQDGIVFHGHCKYYPSVNCTLVPELLDNWLITNT